MKIFMTGGTGFIGSRVVARLADAGYETSCLVRSEPEPGPVAGPGIHRIAAGGDGRL